VLSQNYPNPFDKQTSVLIYLRADSDVEVTVKNALGQTVNAFAVNNLMAGNHEIVIDGSSLSEGIYYYTIETGANSVTRKMQVTK
jgi:hypothetical protein